jgi:hypothetical protein
VLNPKRSPFPSGGLIALQLPVDSLNHDLERHSGLGPATHALERRTHDADEMAIVPAAEIRLNLATIRARISHD